MPYFVYIHYSKKPDKYYIGQTENFENWLISHNSGRNISTKGGVLCEIKYSEKLLTRAEAMNRETEIKKKKSRNYLEWLISSDS